MRRPVRRLRTAVWANRIGLANQLGSANRGVVEPNWAGEPVAWATHASPLPDGGKGTLRLITGRG